MPSKKPRNTRELLIDSAFKSFYKQGFQGSNILEILSDVKINKGSMYYYFKSKKELGIAVIEERIQRNILTKYTQVLQSTNPTRTLFEILKSAPETLIYGCPLNKMAQEMIYIDKEFQVALSLAYDVFEAIINKILIKGIENKEIASTDTVKMTKLIIATYEGALMIYHLNQDKKIFRETLENLQSKL